MLTWLKDLGIDLIDVSSGALTTKARIPVAKGYQVPFARQIRLGVSTRSIKPLKPGEAACARIDGQIALVACDQPEHALLGNVRYDARVCVYTVEVERVSVPVVSILLRLTTGDSERLYVGWIDELGDDAGVIESLATQAELAIILAGPLGQRIGTARTENGMRAVANNQLGIISKLAQRPWNRHHFAAARAYIESQYPTLAALWERMTK